MRRLLLALAVLPLAACERGGLPPDPNVHVEVPPDTAQHPAATAPPLLGQQRLHADPYAVVPGVRVGQVRLGMPFDSLLVTLGQPPHADAGMGKAWGAWPGWGDARDVQVQVLALANPDVSTYLVAQVQVDGPPFHTEGGLPVHASRAEVLRLYPTARPFGRNGLYDDRRGIAFTFAAGADTSRATSMLIVPPGTPAEKVHPAPGIP